jgi:hypothetical protein
MKPRSITAGDDEQASAGSSRREFQGDPDDVHYINVVVVCQFFRRKVVRVPPVFAGPRFGRQTIKFLVDALEQRDSFVNQRTLEFHHSTGQKHKLLRLSGCEELKERLRSF